MHSSELATVAVCQIALISYLFILLTLFIYLIDLASIRFAYAGVSHLYFHQGNPQKTFVYISILTTTFFAFRYQKQLQDNYVTMYKRSRDLEQQVKTLTSQLNDFQVCPDNTNPVKGEEKLCFPMEI